MAPCRISSAVESRAFLIIAEARSKSSVRESFTRATPCSVDFMAQATASLGKTSHSSILGSMSRSCIPLSLYIDDPFIPAERVYPVVWRVIYNVQSHFQRRVQKALYGFPNLLDRIPIDDHRPDDVLHLFIFLPFQSRAWRSYPRGQHAESAAFSFSIPRLALPQ